MAWVFFPQRRDEDRHAQFFDRIAAEVLGVPGDTPAERRAAARAHVPPACSSSSRRGCPRWPPSSRRAALDWARASLSTTWFSRASSSTPRITRCAKTWPTTPCPGFARAFGASSSTSAGTSASACAAWSSPSPPEISSTICWRAEEAASVWGDAVPDATREYIADVCHRRLAVVGLIEPHVAA